MLYRTILTMLTAAAISLPSVAFAAAPFQDVLDLPAARSALAASSLINGVALAGKRLVGVGQRGHIVYSDDQGKSWTQSVAPVSSDLLAVHFPTPKKGWAVGHDGVVLHSADGGAGWTRQFDGRAAARVMKDSYRGAGDKAGSAAAAGLTDEVQKLAEQGADKPFLDVWFENESTGFIVGAFSLIFRTADGGKSWTPWYDRIQNPKRLHLNAIRPVGKDLFIAAEQGAVFKLDRKAARFQGVKTPYEGTFFGITGKPGSVLAFGMRGNAFVSRNDGAAWRKVETGVQTGLTSGTVTEDGRIVLVSQGGQVLVSKDNGSSFSPIKIEQPVPAVAVTALGGGALALAGPRGVKVQSIE